MIVSASLVADVPAHHGEWFMRRLDAGFCRIAGDDPLQSRRVSLTRDAVDAFVFWTRDPAPFTHALDEISRRGFPFVIQCALTGPPSPVHAFRALAERFGPRAMVWRYDPVAEGASSVPFEKLAKALKGCTDEVVLAFRQPANRARIAENGAWIENGPRRDRRRSIVKTLAPIALDHGMRLKLCGQPEYLASGASPARCVDAKRIDSLTGGRCDIPTAGFFPDCLCTRAIDIGDGLGAAARRYGGAWLRKDILKLDADSEYLVAPHRRFASAAGGDLPF